MKKIDFYKKKEKLHMQIISGVCKILDANMVEFIDFEELEMCGGYICLAKDGLAVEHQVSKLKHTIGTDHLEVEVHDEWCNSIHADLNEDVLDASCDTVYDAVYDLFCNKQFKEKRKQFYDTQRITD